MATAPRKTAAKRVSKPAADKASGKHIPAPPTAPPPAAAAEPVGAMAAIAAAAPAPQPVYAFEPAGAPHHPAPHDPAAAAREAALARTVIPDGLTWIDEYTALGRRIALVRGGDGEPTLTHEEIVPHGAPDALVHAARARLSSKFVVA